MPSGCIESGTSHIAGNALVSPSHCSHFQLSTIWSSNRLLLLKCPCRKTSRSLRKTIDGARFLHRSIKRHAPFPSLNKETASRATNFNREAVPDNTQDHSAEDVRRVARQRVEAVLEESACQGRRAVVSCLIGVALAEFSRWPLLQLERPAEAAGWKLPWSEPAVQTAPSKGTCATCECRMPRSLSMTRVWFALSIILESMIKLWCALSTNLAPLAATLNGLLSTSL
jgi:hypothetical protein